jgi:serine/threonine protein kinase
MILLPAPPVESSVPPARVVGRYLMYDEIACGGMASVHYGRLVGLVGFSRTVAIKYLHPQFSRDAEFVSMFLDEARLVARIQHPNVAAPLDVVVLEDSKEIFLVMEYVHGENLSRLIGSARSSKLPIPPAIGASIICGALRGLHAAHEAVDEQGTPLDVVHRDISPQNIMVGVDGVARVLDFGVAKAAARCQSTQQGQLKGKLAYMAPEQLRAGGVDRRVDIFAAGIVLWEALTQRRLFQPNDAASALALVLGSPIRRPSQVNPAVPAELDRVVMKALERDVKVRFQTAGEFADAIEEASTIASTSKVGEWVKSACGNDLSKRAGRVSAIERSTSGLSSADDIQRLLPHKSGTRLGEESTDPGNPAKAARSATGSIPSDKSVDDHLPRSSSDPSAGNPPRRRKSWLVAAGASAILLAAAASFVVLWPRGREAGTGNGPGQDPSRSLVETNRQAVPTTLAVNVPVAPPPSPVAATAPASPTSHNEAVVRAKSGKVASPKKPRPAKSDCSPPYFLDSEGIRRVKPQCL